MTIYLCQKDEEIIECFDVMSQLRPHLKKEEFVATVRELQEIAGFQLVALKLNGVIEAVGGFKISKSLAWGKFLYIDDLVTNEKTRSSGCGKQLMDWLIDLAKENNCGELHLDSGVQRFDAHRFYLRERMNIVFHHFRLDL